MPLRAGKAMIASRLSLAPEYFSPVLRELAAAGLTQITRGDSPSLPPRELLNYTLQ